MAIFTVLWFWFVVSHVNAGDLPTATLGDVYGRVGAIGMSATLTNGLRPGLFTTLGTGSKTGLGGTLGLNSDYSTVISPQFGYALDPGRLANHGYSSGYNTGYNTGYTTGYSGGYASDHTPGYHSAAIQTSRTYQMIPLSLTRDPPVPQIIDIGPTEQPVQVIFRTVSSPVSVRQFHTPGTPGQIESTRSEDEPHRVLHEVLRPVIQEVREVIQPYRRVVQEVRPVLEEVHTVVSKADGYRNNYRNDGNAYVNERAPPAYYNGLSGGHNNGLSLGHNNGLSLSQSLGHNGLSGYKKGRAAKRAKRA